MGAGYRQCLGGWFTWGMASRDTERLGWRYTVRIGSRYTERFGSAYAADGSPRAHRGGFPRIAAEASAIIVGSNAVRPVIGH